MWKKKQKIIDFKAPATVNVENSLFLTFEIIKSNLKVFKRNCIFYTNVGFFILKSYFYLDLDQGDIITEFAQLIFFLSAFSLLF